MTSRIRALFAAVLAFGFLCTPLAPAVPASASFDCQSYRETSYVMCGVFLRYWLEHGGIAQQGYPISTPVKDVSQTDGQTYDIQYFERAVFELHNGGTSPEVLLSLLGVFRYNQKYPNGAASQLPNMSTGSVLFNETGKRLGGRFLDYWKSHGSLAQQGYPISEEFTEVSELDGKPYLVQYFERAVFEYHPENHSPNDVLLSQLGRFRYNSKYPDGFNGTGSNNPDIVPEQTVRSPQPPTAPTNAPLPPHVATGPGLEGTWNCTLFWTRAKGNMSCAGALYFVHKAGGSNNSYYFELWNISTGKKLDSGTATQGGNEVFLGSAESVWGPAVLLTRNQMEFFFVFEGSSARLIYERE